MAAHRPFGETAPEPSRAPLRSSGPGTNRHPRRRIEFENGIRMCDQEVLVIKVNADDERTLEWPAKVALSRGDFPNAKSFAAGGQ